MSDKVGEMLREIMQDYMTLASERDELMQSRNGLIENNDNLHIQLAEMRSQRDEGLAREAELATSQMLIAQIPEHPAGAIHNGRFAIERLENTYDFQEQMGHRLALCSDWQEVVRCFEYLASHAEQVAFLASSACTNKQKPE